LLNIEAIKLACTDDTIIITEHARERMKERNIRYDDIISSIMCGEIIEQYEDDKPYPSCLILGCESINPLHIVLSFDAGAIWVITAYVPTPEKWNLGFKTRKAAELK